MRLSELIINDIKPVKSSSKISELQELFNQLTYSHIPVQDNNGVFAGTFLKPMYIALIAISW